jgi:hypothetical protein
MNWSRKKFSRWTSGDFTITEIEATDGRPYQLDSLDTSPEFFQTLREAQGVARLKHQLALTQAENANLRKELSAHNAPATSAITLVRAIRQHGPQQEDEATRQQRLADEWQAEQGVAEFDSSWPDEGGFDATDPDPPLQSMTDTVIDRAIPENPEADAIAAELIEVMDRNEHRERALPSLSFH